ncbi:hypothetical protein BLOT_003450 [Blomia tropicalis]|nr:hypothetical protein BLOT_003450 [Blomia tropicalis]
MIDIRRKIKKPDQPDETFSPIDVATSTKPEEKPVESSETTEIVLDSRDEEQTIDVEETKIVDESIIVDGKKIIERKIKRPDQPDETISLIDIATLTKLEKQPIESPELIENVFDLHDEKAKNEMSGLEMLNKDNYFEDELLKEKVINENLHADDNKTRDTIKHVQLTSNTNNSLELTSENGVNIKLDSIDSTEKIHEPVQEIQEQTVPIEKNLFFEGKPSEEKAKLIIQQFENIDINEQLNLETVKEFEIQIQHEKPIIKVETNEYFDFTDNTVVFNTTKNVGTEFETSPIVIQNEPMENVYLREYGTEQLAQSKLIDQNDLLVNKKLIKQIIKDESIIPIIIESSVKLEEKSEEKSKMIKNVTGTIKEEQIIDVDETKVVNETLEVDGKKKIERKVKKPDQLDESTILTDIESLIKLEEIAEVIPETIEFVPESRDEEQSIEVDETKIVDEKKKVKRKVKKPDQPDESITSIDIESSIEPVEKPDEIPETIEIVSESRDEEQAIEIDEIKIFDEKKKIKRKIKKPDQPYESAMLIDIESSTKLEDKPVKVPETTEFVPESRDEEQAIDIDETKIVDEKKKIKRKIKKTDQPDGSTTLIDIESSTKPEEKPDEVPETTEIVPESRDEEQTIEVDETKIVDEKKKINEKIKKLDQPDDLQH